MASSYNELFGLGSHSEDGNLEGWWPLLDNAASTTVVDESSNSRNGTLTGGSNTEDLDVTGPNSWLTSALSFSSSDYVSLPTAVAVSGSSVRTYLMRVAVDSFGTAVADPVAEFGGNSTAGREFILYAEDNAFSGGYRNVRYITPKSTLSTGTFYAVGWRVPSGASNVSDVDILIDGVNQTLTKETGSDQTLDTLAPSTACGLGYTPENGGSNYGDGDYSEAAAFSRALTDAEVDDWYDGPEPVNSAAPVVSGTEEEGETLSCTTGTWGLDSPFSSGTNGTITYSYQWTRSDNNSGLNEADIGGATSSTYTLVSADVGKYIRCRVRATNDGGFDSSADTNSGFTGAIASGTSTFTATGTPSLAALTTSGSGTHTEPSFTATGTPSLAALTTSGTGAYTEPTATGSGTPSLAALTTSGSGTHTEPVFTASGTPSLAALTTSGSGTHTEPTFTASGTPSLAALTTSGSGTHTEPVFTGSGTPSLAALTTSGSGTVSGPGDVTATGTPSLAALTTSGSGTHTEPSFTASGTPSLAALTTAGTGAYTEPTVTATGTPSLAALTTSGSGTFTAPSVTGSGTPSLAALTVSGSGTYDLFAGTGAPSLAALTAIGSGTMLFTGAGGGVQMEIPATAPHYQLPGDAQHVELPDIALHYQIQET